MFYPLLENIDKYVKENGIATKDIYISIKRLPTSLMEAASKELERFGRNFTIDDTCVLTYDDNGNLCLVLSYNNMKTNLLITNATEDLSFPNPGFKFTKVRCFNIFREAQRMEWINRKVFSSHKELYNKYLKKYEDAIEKASNTEERNKLLYEFYNKKKELRSILRDQIEFLFNSNSIAVNLNEESILNKELERFENVAKQYIKYINDEYIESKKKQHNNDIVYFTPEEKEYIPRSGESSSKLYLGEPQERKNVVLASDYRDEVIDLLNPIMTKIAIPSVKTGVYVSPYVDDGLDVDSMYTCSLIEVGNNEYKLIIEPFNGMKYTKVAYFTTEDEMTSDLFDEIIKKYISLNEKHVSESKAIIRIGHTTRETYENEIWYSITKDKKLKCHKYFTDKVDSMIPDEIKKEKTL